MMRMPGLAMPVLGVLGLINESMGWGTQPEDVAHFLPPGGTLVPLEDSGHFVHIEHPPRSPTSSSTSSAIPPARSSWGAVGARTPAPSPGARGRQATGADHHVAARARRARLA